MYQTIADVVQFSDYFPFGQVMPNRHGADNQYRYAFNGMEADDEVKGEGNSYDFGARMYDSRIGRWLSIDPLFYKYPQLNPYHFTDNNPIFYMDIDGQDFVTTTVDKIDSDKTPQKAGDLGVTQATKIELKYNEKTKEWDLLAEVTVTVNAWLLTEGTERNSPGLKNEVCAHEQGHVNQIFEALESPIEISINIGGKTQLIKGRADEVLTKMDKEIASRVSHLAQEKIDQGLFKTQEEVDDFVKETFDYYNKNVRSKALQEANDQVGENLKNKMGAEGGHEKQEIENDANKRASKTVDLQYAGGERKPIIIESSKGEVKEVQF